MQSALEEFSNSADLEVEQQLSVQCCWLSHVKAFGFFTGQTHEAVFKTSDLG